MFPIYTFIKRLSVIELDNKLSFCYSIYEIVCIPLILVV